MLQPRERQQQESPTERRLVWLTGLLVVVGLLQVIAIGVQAWIYHRQAKLMAAQLRVTEEMLNATRDAFTLTHRPRLIVRSVVEKGFEEHVVNALKDGTFWIANVGMTDATVLRVMAQWLVAKRLPMENPVNRLVDESDRPPERVAAGAVIERRLPAKTLDFEEYKALADAKELAAKAKGLRDPTAKRLFLVGYVKYVDQIGTFRRTYFCRRYDAVTGRFRAVRDPDYEYAD